MTERQSNGPLDPETGEDTGSDGAGQAGGEPAARDDSPETEHGGVGVDADLVADLEAALENVQIELSRQNDRYLRLAAEFDNYRKRTERERVETYGRAQADVVARLLDVVDDLERVADFDETISSSALLEGVQLVERKLHAALEAVGLEKVDAAGQIFDPASMEALASVPAEGPEEDDRVADVFQQGYRFKGHLVRPARVRVKQYEA